MSSHISLTSLSFPFTPIVVFSLIFCFDKIKLEHSKRHIFAEIQKKIEQKKIILLIYDIWQVPMIKKKEQIYNYFLRKKYLKRLHIYIFSMIKNKGKKNARILFWRKINKWKWHVCQ